MCTDASNFGVLVKPICDMEMIFHVDAHLKMYRFPCKLYASKNSGSPRISFIFENTRETLADDEQLVNELSLVGHPFHDGVCKFIFHQDPKAARFSMDTLDPISFVVATRI